MYPDIFMISNVNTNNIKPTIVEKKENLQTAKSPSKKVFNSYKFDYKKLSEEDILEAINYDVKKIIKKLWNKEKNKINLI